MKAPLASNKGKLFKVKESDKFMTRIAKTPSQSSK